MAFISDDNDMDKLTAAITIKVTPDHREIIERLANEAHALRVENDLLRDAIGTITCALEALPK